MSLVDGPDPDRCRCGHEQCAWPGPALLRAETDRSEASENADCPCSCTFSSLRSSSRRRPRTGPGSGRAATDRRHRVSRSMMPAHPRPSGMRSMRVPTCSVHRRRLRQVRRLGAGASDQVRPWGDFQECLTLVRSVLEASLVGAIRSFERACAGPDRENTSGRRERFHEAEGPFRPSRGLDGRKGVDAVLSCFRSS